jgi:hypothetical protein
MEEKEHRVTNSQINSYLFPYGWYGAGTRRQQFQTCDGCIVRKINETKIDTQPNGIRKSMLPEGHTF